MFNRKLRDYLSSRQGFSLIETSVLVTVAAAAAVGFLSWTQPAVVTNAEKSIETRTRLEEISRAIEIFRVEKGRLPCPADPYMRIDNTRNNELGGTDLYPNDFGQEDLDRIETQVGGVTNFGIDCPVSTGTVPVYALNLGQEYMNDEWGRRITYQVSRNICGSDAGTEGGLSQNLSRLTGCTSNDYTKGIGDIIIKDTAGVTKEPRAAFVLLSHGPNGLGAFMPSGAKMADGSANELENSNAYNAAGSTHNGDKTFVMGAATSSFDDIVYFKTKAQLERLTDRSNTKQVSIEECEANSAAIRQITVTESTAMNTQITGYERGQFNRGEQVALGLLKSIQTMCISYYGATAKTINGKTWSGAQCPGTANVTAGSTYYVPLDTCTCESGLWNGNCTMDWNIIGKNTVPDGRVVWLDAYDTSTLFTDANCTTQVTANGNTIGCWKDKSATASNHAKQGTAASQPVYTTSAINSKSVVNFVSSDSLVLPVPSVLGILNSDYEVFFVARTTSSAVQFLMGGGLEQFELHINGSAGLRFIPVSSKYSDIGGSSAYLTNPRIFGARVDNNNGIVRVSGVGDTTDIETSARSSNNSAIVLGYRGNNQYPMIGYIGEVMIYKRALTTTERQTVEQYLSQKWAISS